MALFLSDLDNTLIYSYKKDIGNEKILVEQKEGKELSFMTQYAVKCLIRLQTKLPLIPLTTRSLLQYQRIAFPAEICPHYALAANGGILLIDGEIDKEWFSNSKNLIEPAYEEMKKGKEILHKDSNVYYSIEYIDNLFVFTKSKNPEQTISELCKKLDLSIVSIHENGEKIYILPNMLHKGKAIERIKERFTGESIICAGDSIFDIPMLFAADSAYYPKGLENALCSIKTEAEFHHKLKKISDKIFSDGMLTHLQNQIFME